MQKEFNLDYDRIITIKANLNKIDGMNDDIAQDIVLSELGEKAEALFGMGWLAIDIRDCVIAMNRAFLENALPEKMVEDEITRRLEDAQFRKKPEFDAPGDHLARLKKEVTGWGESYSFTFGIQNLDNAWGGLMPGELCVLVGSQGSMKTSLALNGVEHFLRENPKDTVLFFSLDMTAQELSVRLIMRDLDASIVEVYGMMRENSREYLEAEKRFSEATKGKLKILGNTYKNRWSIDGVENQIALRNPALVVIDFLTCLKKPGQSDLEGVEEIMPRLQGITQRLKIKTLLLSQMGRSSKIDQSKGAIGGHSKGGGIIEELAHAEIELMKDAPLEPGNPPRVIATVTKTRRGINGASFNILYHGKRMEFTGASYIVDKDKERKPVFLPRAGF